MAGHLEQETRGAFCDGLLHACHGALLIIPQEAKLVLFNEGRELGLIFPARLVRIAWQLRQCDEVLAYWLIRQPVGIRFELGIVPDFVGPGNLATTEGFPCSRSQR